MVKRSVSSALRAVARSAVAYAHHGVKVPRAEPSAPVTIPSERWIRYHVRGTRGETLARVDIPTTAESYVHDLARELTQELLRRHPDATVVWLD